MTIHNAKDNSLKKILSEPELFVDFIKDYVKIDLFKDIKPTDIEDMTERFLPLFQDNKDSGTVKRINLKGSGPLFVIAIVEHESQVNFRTSFKMLQYITLVLTEYEKDANKENRNASKAKNFKFPPVLPIVFYDGVGNWSAETNFLDRTELSDVFYKYIPKFEYALVSINQYEVSDLVQFGNALSLIMIIDKIQTVDGLSLLTKLPPDYIAKLQLNIPPHLDKLLADVITVLLKRINVPNEEISEITEHIYQRRLNEMFNFIEDYDVQETRRVAREEGIKEGIKEGIIEGKKEGINEKSYRTAKRALKMGDSPEHVAYVVELPLRKVLEIQASLS